ncbi:ACT domain-containing protein [Rhodobacteraceae bacterium KMM 6894]|nr:ACT domain-containing protein [Rhodobacteraceae bacterium KMM 6894]
MSGEHDLNRLLAGMSPLLDPETYVFVTVADRAVPVDLNPLMMMQEAEGTTLILPRDTAVAHGLEHQFACRRITLNVHSALDAVGFLAKVGTRLAALGMGVNPVAGYFHDHLFIPDDRAEVAMRALHEMTAQARSH